MYPISIAYQQFGLIVKDTIFYELHQVMFFLILVLKYQQVQSKPDVEIQTTKKKRHHPFAYNQEIHSTVRQPLAYQQQIH